MTHQNLSAALNVTFPYTVAHVKSAIQILQTVPLFVSEMSNARARQI